MNYLLRLSSLQSAAAAAAVKYNKQALLRKSTTTTTSWRRLQSSTRSSLTAGRYQRVSIRAFSSSKNTKPDENNNDNNDNDTTDVIEKKHYPHDHVTMPSNSYGSLGEGLFGGGGGGGTTTAANHILASQQQQPWQAAHNAEVQRVTQKALIYELVHEQTATIEQVVPWFLANMPPSYFEQVPEPYRIDHIKAIAAIRDANLDLFLNLKSHTPDGRTVLTFIRPGTQPGTLLKMVEELPNKFDLDAPLSRLHVFSTKDESMSLNMFVYGQSKQAQAPIDRNRLEQIAKPILDTAAAILQQQQQQDKHEPTTTVHSSSLLCSDKHKHLLEREALLEYMSRCRPTYVQIGARNPARFLQQRILFDRVSGTEGTAIHIEQAPADITDNPRHPVHYWLDFAVANSMPQVALENLVQLLFHYEFDVARARLDVVPDGSNGSVTILRTLIAPTNHRRPVPPDVWEALSWELKRSKWLDPDTVDLVFDQYPWLGVTRGEIITAFASLMHPVLAKENALAYSKANILFKLSNERFIGHASEIADIFLERFRPENPLSDEQMEERMRVLLETIQNSVEDSVATEILIEMMDICRATLKTNVYMPNRYALGFRLDPKIMVPKGQENKEDLPYGIVFVHGRRFNGFHVRFRDISRGGLRLVTPANSELLALESARQYDECYGLAFAQQLKNKDIPEGGSKAVNLINTIGLSATGKNFVMRKSVKAFADTILDLIVDTEETRSEIVDRYGKPEVLYLGPDEQVTQDDIEWIVQRAALRGYPTPAAFMSSKPRAGINHKEFGVTSEGVNVYLDTALRHVLKIDPTKDPFTIKMTGGPDGDVAGNEIKILIREYGDNAKIVGVADHSGCAEDPAGLAHDELLRLVKEGSCISNFDRSKLGPNGVLHTVDTPEGVKARNSMHNRLEASAFIPCGGRPNTIDISNYKHFLKPDGTPSAPLIVEGANLFVTAEARKALYDTASVVIVKDSSANKGGVITSSYEICAAMLLSEDEFVTYKEAIVQEVLQKLRALALLEAKLLFREMESQEGRSLPEISQVISNCINAATDALTSALDKDAIEELLPLFRAHLPPTLAELAFDRVHERVPAAYIQNAIASTLAAKMVYKEGTKFMESLPPKKMAAIALKYLEKEKEVASLMESLRGTDMPETEKQRVLDLLEAGGARTALGVY